MRLPLRALLGVPFFVQALVLAAIIVVLSYRTGAEAVRSLTERLVLDISARVEQSTRAHIGAAELIGKSLAVNASSGLLDLKRAGDLERHLWEASAISPAASYVYFGDRDGRFTGVERLPGAGAVVRIREAGERGLLGSFGASEPGDRAHPIAGQFVEYDPRMRPWYRRVEAARAADWSPVYPSASKGILVVTYAVPVYDDKHRLVGVGAVDIALDHLARFLRELPLSPRAVVYVIDRTGHLIATSRPPARGERGTRSALVEAATSTDRLIALTAQSLGKRGADDPPGARLSRLAGDDGTLLAAATPIRSQGGLDWTIVVAAPEADFLGGIVAETRNTALVAGAATLLVMLAGLAVLAWITRDLRRLNDAARNIAAGEWPAAAALPTHRRDEVGELARSFGSMTKYLESSLKLVKDTNFDLARANATLEARVRERTEELAQRTARLEAEVVERREADYRTRRLASVVERAADAILICTAGGEIEYVNSGFERLTGYRAGEVLGRTPAFLKSGEHDAAFYRTLNETIYAGREYAGVLVNRRQDGSRYHAEITISPVFDDAGVLRNLVSIQRDVTAREEARARLVALLATDHGTGLLNRAGLAERVARLLGAGHRRDDPASALTLLYLDLDGFKAINDRCGHAAGDAALAQVARRIGSAVRERDLVARVGGDEFVVVLPGLDGREHATQIARNICERVAEPLVLERDAPALGVAIGIARYPADGDTFEALLARADAAMYEAKRQGRGRFAFAR